MADIAPWLILGALALTTIGIAVWAVRDLIGVWSGKSERRASGVGHGVISAMAEIQQMFEPSIVHVEQVDEEAETEQDQDGE